MNLEDIYCTQDYSLYTEEDHKVWQTLCERQNQSLRGKACRQFYEGLEKIGLDFTRMPRLDDINDRIKPITGWTARAVPGYLDSRYFFKSLQQRTYPTTVAIRSAENIDYVEEPDIFHDVFGHMALMADRVYGQFMQTFGEIQDVVTTDQDVLEMTRLFWFTIEFGLIQQDGQSRILGSGLLSSPGEAVNCLSDRVKRRPFILAHVIAQPFRIDVYQESIPLRQQLALSTCGLLESFSLSDTGNGSFTIATSAYTVDGFPACVGEPFANQPTAMFCTGFLVGPDLIATAGHCYDGSDIATTRFVFGFVMLNVTTPVTVVDADQVYTGIEVVGHALSGDLDYAVIRVDRDVVAPGAVPLEIRRSGTIPLGTQIGVIGHPWGLPLKIAFGSQTTVRDQGPSGYFTANLDTYGGNSGSPVFNAATGVVEGILVRGATDFVIQSDCFVSNQLTNSQGGEDVSKTTTFMQFIVLPLDTVYVDFSWGGVETGEASMPYNTVLEGLAGVNPGGTIIFKGDAADTDSTDTLTIDQAVTLTALNGAVQIGVPSTPGDPYVSTNVPVTIMDNVTVISTLSVPGSVTISDVNVTLNITHTWDDDLQIELVSPNSTTVMLINLRGGDGDNFTDTTLNDEAPTAIFSGTPPFTGSFRPEVSLTNFDGENAQGTWTLRITDTFAVDTGALNSWSITLNAGDRSASTQSGTGFISHRRD